MVAVSVADRCSGYSLIVVSPEIIAVVDDGLAPVPGRGTVHFRHIGPAVVSAGQVGRMAGEFHQTGDFPVVAAGAARASTNI